MSDKKTNGESPSALELIVRKVLENIESPFVWMPLGLSVICIIAYPIVKMALFAYVALAFLLITFVADWIGRFHNIQVPKKKKSKTNQEDSSDLLASQLISTQEKAISLIEAGKLDSARVLSNRNLNAIDAALKKYPNDPKLLTVLGYTAKDIYQTSKGKLPPAQRKAILARANVSFSEALKLVPKDPGANNGLGNVLFFEGLFDEAIKQHKLAIKLAGGHYDAAENDLRLVEMVKSGKLPLDF
jgi:tetratricopeptide (TPR) repeat protein